MHPLEMIAEWRKGCSIAGPEHSKCFPDGEPLSPGYCVACTEGLIDAIQEALTKEPFLIWSNEHSAWWNPGRAGYTTHLALAGRYSHAEALAISVDARGGWRPGSPPPEIPVAEADAVACEERWSAMMGDKS